MALKCYHWFDLSFQCTDQASTSIGHFVGTQGHNQAYLTASAPQIDESPTWHVDSGATNHNTADLNNLSLQSGYKGKDKVIVGNGSKLSISHIGNSIVQSNITNVPLFLNHILHVPNIIKDLLSISPFT